ncbi:hypothetical protein XA26_53290 [Mycolicibacterium fortuitum]|uniref:Uncharacterized protein n=1 Tax=Mycolicibacterium fortuitum TaxID=1766 RepID=A0A0N9YLT0_MYCFO|nr:DUF4173 domain-containing protein [Mycolicibacterium fortuitum]ALI29121.1 hypothetical protein XA26_53290 [Mycolicibacterium fortuitum]OBG47552.1 hypothetical protein A5670_03995 [Mycolicibacterium fortuitum]
MTTTVSGLPAPLIGPAQPRQGEPGWTVWSRRVWPLVPLAAAPRRVLASALVAGLVGTAVWRVSVLSVGYLVVGVLVFGVVYGTAPRRPSRVESFGIGLTLALLAVPALLAAEWMGALCLSAAWIVGWCTLAGGGTWTAVFSGPFLPWVLFGRLRGWVEQAVKAWLPDRSGLPSLGRVAAVAGLTVGLVVVFGALFAAADPAFAHFAGNLVPSFDGVDFAARAVVFGIVVTFVLGGAYLVRFPPRLDALAPAPMQPVPRWEWALPLGVLDALFVAFVAVQATVLFGGHTHVLETEGLTYAEYARQGFWQLLWVSALTLLVLSGVIRVAGRGTAADRRLVRILVGILCATSIVVVISSIHRMWLYQQAYGFSTERLMVITTEVWLGVVFVLVAIAGIRMTGRWLPRAVLVAGALALLGLAALNPERLIADRNIDRFEQTGALDAEYLSGLSSDIDPALARLPEHVRSCVQSHRAQSDPWYQFNLSRWSADRPENADLPEYCSSYWSYPSYR